MFKVPEKYRIIDHPILPSDESFGNNGCFGIRFTKEKTAWIIASDGGGWEHVSIHITYNGKGRTPTWEDMCRIKDLFWSKEDCVVQYHPAKSDYVNNHKHTLHLWRPINQVLPKPDSLMVGIK